MTVLEMMKQNIESVVGKSVSYCYGGSNPLIGVVRAVKKNVQPVTLDGEPNTITSYLISFDGSGFYVVDKFTKIIEEPQDLISNFVDRQSFLGLKKMEIHHLKKSKSTKCPIKKVHHLEMADQFNDKSYRILEKYLEHQ